MLFLTAISSQKYSNSCRLQIDQSNNSTGAGSNESASILQAPHWAWVKKCWHENFIKKIKKRQHIIADNRRWPLLLQTNTLGDLDMIRVSIFLKLSSRSLRWSVIGWITKVVGTREIAQYYVIVSQNKGITEADGNDYGMGRTKSARYGKLKLGSYPPPPPPPPPTTTTTILPKAAVMICYS